MRRAAWLVVLGAVCVGCAKKEEPALPDVRFDQGEAKGTGGPPPAPKDPLAGKVGALDYGKLWDPAETAKADAATVVKQIVALRYFANHQTEYLAAATVGTLAGAAHGSPHAFVAPRVLATAYPEVAAKTEATWKDRLMATASPGVPALDFGARATDGASVRVLVIRAKGGTDDELRSRFGDYLTRLEAAVKGTGVAVTAHQRGGLRATGALSDVRYEWPGGTGHVRSVVVRGYDPDDPELVAQMLGDAAKDDTLGLFKSVMNADKGPFLIVSLNERPR